jgi:hypothetical protein
MPNTLNCVTPATARVILAVAIYNLIHEPIFAPEILSTVTVHFVV